MAKHTNNTDARVASTTRRSMLGLIAGVPVAATFGTIALPATAATNRHAAWLAERNRLSNYLNATPMTDAEIDALDDRMMPIEHDILHTPADNIEEARAKLCFAARLHAEGACLSHDDGAELFAELAKWFAAH